MTIIREHLAAQVSRKLERYGVVIWDDPEGAYRSNLEKVAPATATICSFKGSWYEIRREVEPLLSGETPPTLLVYVSAKRPDPDPLEELRAIGSSFRIRLPTLLKQALAGKFTEQRIIDIAEQCLTFSQAEAALRDGESAVDIRLISVIHETEAAAVVARLVAGTHAAELDLLGLDNIIRHTFAKSLGGNFGDLNGKELREAIFRHIILTLIRQAVRELPAELISALGSSDAAQQRMCETVIQRMRMDPELKPAYIEMAGKADVQLRLAELLSWEDSLAAVDVTLAIVDLAVHRTLQYIKRSEYLDAIKLTATVLSGWWTSSEAPNGNLRATRWRLIGVLAKLGKAMSEPIPAIRSLEEMTNWYIDTGWQVDSLFRQSEFIRVTSGDSFDELDDLFERARRNYEEWLDTVLRLSTDSMKNLQETSTMMQRSIHRRNIANSGGGCAYVLVDALRYELGWDLTNRLDSLDANVSIKAAIATPPTITSIGMAALLPGSDTAFGVDLEAGDRLFATVGGQPVYKVIDRVRHLEHFHGKVANLQLDEVAQFSNRELKDKIADTDLVLVRSTEIDSSGEMDRLAASWASLDSTLTVLHTAVAKLLYAGRDRVVLTSDHGFLAIRQLGEDRRIDKPPTGKGELHRRAWIGRGGTITDSTVRVALADFGIVSDLDIITPRGLGVFTAGGGLQFFHGGLSPQELIVPVITVVATENPNEPQYEVSLEVAGESITTGVIAVRVTMIGDLFTCRSRVRLQLIQENTQVAVVVSGDGVDMDSKSISVSAGKMLAVVMQVTANLKAGSTVSLEVLDAATGVRLSKLDVEVVADVIVEETLV